MKGILFYIIGGLAGAVGGYLYWHFVGCSGGSCAIWSSSWKSTLAGLILGVLGGGSVFDLLTYLRKNDKQNDHRNTNSGK